MKITPVEQKKVITAKTTDKKKITTAYQWWKAPSKRDLCDQLLGTAAYLKENQNYRYRQAQIYARLYGNMSLFSFAGSNSTKLDQQTGLPSDRPTFNVVQSVADTLVSRISQNRPAPVFLTDNSDYRERNLAKKLNNFIQGEFYQTKVYELAPLILRDALVLGTGCLKVFEAPGNKVGVERVLPTELLTDPNESIYGKPRQLYQMKLIDRAVLMDMCPEFASTIERADKAFPDNSSDSAKSVSDLVMVIEGWHLPSGPGAKDGRHTLACSSGIIFDDREWAKDNFPFVFLHYSPRLLGFWAQGIAEQLMGTQMEINSLLYTISRAIKLVGVPRVFQEVGSKVIRAHNNNDVGVIIEYKGIKPSYEVAPCNAPELYEQLQRLITYAYEQSGVSALQASSTKPAGLNSGEAIRSYDDISTDRFAALSRRYDTVFIDLAYQIMDCAKEIAEREGEYQTVYPSKNSAKQIDLPKLDLIKNPFVIQCFNMSSLPKDPAGRMQKVTEMIQAGMITIKEGRRLLDYPDLDQVEQLANASEERIYQVLDNIVEDGKYEGPDPFMDLSLANDIVVQYYNLYAAAKLEPKKKNQLMDFFNQVQDMVQQAQTPQAPQGAPTPQANPEPLPTSPLIPNAPQPAAA